VRTDVKLNRKTTLARLYIYEDVHTYIEYPETSADHPIGHLFQCNPDNWQDAVHNFAYSLGLPSGCTRKGDEITFSLLQEMDNGNLVPCIKRHWTCM
jgi:hypothetical protein